MTEAKKANQHRDLLIAYKKTFGDPHGKLVLMDLMNRFHILNSHKGDAFMEGQRSAVLYVLGRTKMDLEKFDEFLKGQAQ